MVTSGYINQEPLREIAPYFDVIKVDLKGYDEKFYLEETGGHLTNVLLTLLSLKKMDKLVEIVNLVIPQRNDSDKDLKNLCQWVYDNMGPDTPLFFTRYLPNYRLNNLPPTPLETLLKARAYAFKAGLNFVYIGNAPEAMGENTYCPVCHTLLIEREGYWIKRNILRDGRCPVCGRKIPGIWK
jgi:pyruvate formate lyase activating enzyme